MRPIDCVVLFLWSISSLNTVRADPCQKQFFRSDSFVCVCNSSYCDTVEDIDQIDQLQNSYNEFITSRKEYRLNKFKKKFDTEKSTDSQAYLVINRTKSYQSIIGFGGAVTDATGFNLFSLSQATISNFLNSYFSSSGIEYNVLRVPLAGVDFSTRKYTYNDQNNDLNLTSFSLQPEDINWKIPIIKAAQKLNTKTKIKLFASAWSSPPWMKTNNDYTGEGVLLGPVGGPYYDIWAKYYVKFFQAYQKYDLEFWGVTAQNEPSDCLISKFPFNCLGFTAEMQADFVTLSLGPQLANNGFEKIKIMILDDHRLFLPLFPQKLFQHTQLASKYVSGIAVHWYLDFVVPPSVLDETNKLFPDKFIFETESCLGQGPQEHVELGSFMRGESYAKYIIQLNNYDTFSSCLVTGWTDWNLCLDLNGGPNWSKNFVDAPIIVDTKLDQFYKQPMFYVMGHFSKFVPVDSVRINVAGTNDSSLHHIAFYTKDTNQTTLIILNESETDIAYSVYDPDLNVYINSMIENHSIKTIVWFDKI